MLVGLTGGIASGKSYVAEILSSLGAEVIDADEVYSRLILPGEPLYNEIVSIWGRNILNDDGIIDRKKFSSIIFSRESERLKLNALTHPCVIGAVKDYLKGRSGEIIVFMAPLLVEAGLVEFVDELWVVAVDEALQVQRLMRRDGLSKTDARQRVESQISQNERQKHAFLVIDNNGTRQMTRKQVTQLWKELKERRTDATS